MVSTASLNTPQKIHPHKFTLWVGLGSMIMMFAGLTSAYIVKKNQSTWLQFDLPLIFWYSTAVIIIRSVTMYLSAKAFSAKKIDQYKIFLTLTFALGVLFLVMQAYGFKELEAKHITMIGPKSNSAASFLFVITLLHMLHVLGGVIALLFILIKAFSKNLSNFSIVPTEIVGTYWHFVDLLWIYLFLFYNWIG